MTGIDEAIKRQWDHVQESLNVNRTNWTRDQWVDDAKRLMSDVDGSVLDLLNGHVMAMLSKIKELENAVEQHSS